MACRVHHHGISCAANNYNDHFTTTKRRLPLRINLILSLAALIILSYHSPTIAADLTIPGTGDGVAVLNAIGADFKQATGLDVEIPKSVGSSGGMVMAGSGQAELARVARTIKDSEKHFNLTYKPVFNVPTVFYVSPDVAVNDLSEEQILAIFSGKISNWKVVGGQDEEIKVFVREAGDSSYNNLKKTFPGFDATSFSPKAIVALKTPQMVTFLKFEKNAIGFGPLDVALANDLTFTKVEGVSPTDPNYNFYGTIGLVYKSENLSDASRKFLDFISSNAADAAIKNFGGSRIK
jgi:phosphate transport system substrate-binding protein